MGKLTEKEVSLSIRKRLTFYQWTGQIEWYERLQSLKIQHHGHWVMGCAKGTPDYLALMRNREGGITAVFIEVKSPTGQLRPEQRAFADKYNKRPGIFVLKITDPKQLDSFISEYSIDTMKDLPKEI